MRRGFVMTALTLFCIAAPAEAQRDVARRDFLYLGRNLTIEVASPVAGELHVVRGEPGRIEVTGRARDGFFGAGLAERSSDRLRLVAVGSDHVEYLVVVPEDVRVRVRLPDRQLTETAGVRELSRYVWGGGPAEAAAAPAGAPGTAQALPPGMHRLYLNAAAPRVLSLPDRRRIRSLTLRVGEGDWFEVSGSRLLRLEPGSPHVLEIRPEAGAVDLVVSVPRGTGDFFLRIGEETAFTISSGKTAAHCSPVVSQRLSAGREIHTFTPDQRRLQCDALRPRTPPAPRTRAGA